jgi:flagellar hook-length control protein FliK
VTDAATGLPGSGTGTTADGTTHGKKLGAADPKSVSDALQAALAALSGAQGVQGAVPTQAATLGGASSATTGTTGVSTDGGVSLHGSGHGKTAASGLMPGDAKGKAGEKGEQTTATNASNADTAGQDAADALAAAATSDAQDTLSTLKSTADAASAALAASQAAAASASNPATAAMQGANPAAAAAAASTLAPTVGTSDWEDALGQKVVFLSNAHQQSAELTLNPADLGPLQVVLQVADNHAHALFVSQHAQVREAVEAALPKLREAMESNGIGLGSASVSDGFGAGAGAGRQAGAGRGGSSGNGRSASGGDEEADDAVVNVAVRQTVGLVDTFA